MTSPNDTQLRDALLGLAADISANHHPQPAATLWLRAQYRARHAALARAALPLRIMHALGMLAALVTTAFILHQSHTATGPGTFNAVLWISLASILLLAGCALVILLGRQNAATSPSH